MTNQAIDIRATFVGPMQFDVTSATGHTIALDVPESDGGTNHGPTPMELLLMALAGCTGMDVISILKKKRQIVTAYEIRVSGSRAEKHPRVYVDVSRNGRRRFCSTSCQNRVKTAAFRARKVTG